MIVKLKKKDEEYYTISFFGFKILFSAGVLNTGILWKLSVLTGKIR